jgi:IclR family mhp operon transcriptional activator
MQSHPATEKGEYKEVRGLVRGLELLRALNSMPGGGASTSALAKACAMHRTTAKRLLETLRQQGVVQLGTKDGFYMLSDSVLQLSSAVHRVAWIFDVALPVMKAAAARLRWHCDIATYHNGRMIVRESTYRWTPVIGHRAMIGECLSVTGTAMGNAFLAGCDDVTLKRVLDEVLQEEGGDADEVLAPLHASIAATRSRGYALKAIERTAQQHLGAIAVAIEAPGLRAPLAVLSLVYERAAVNQERIERSIFPELRQVARQISQDYVAWRQRTAS